MPLSAILLLLSLSFLSSLLSSKRRGAALVAAAALLAHLGCLRSTFYLDDFVQIIDTDLVDHGQLFVVPLRALTYLTYWLTWRLFGMSAPAFHVGNLLVHVAASLTVLGFAREYLTDAARLPAARAARIALGAGLLFAVHPLCSEVLNYVRARDIALVGEFSLLAGWAVLRWQRDGRARWLAAMGAAALAATFSKEVGCIIAGSTMALVWFAARRGGVDLPARPVWTWTRGRVAVLAAVATVGGLAAIRFSRGFAALAVTLRHSLENRRLGWHTLTQARVFWQYAARVFLPAGLCSDHQIAWTVSAADAVAWIALAALAALALAAAVVLVRAGPLTAGRAAASLGAVALVDILHRLANVTGELMVEYRMYPVMMGLCVLLAWGWDRLTARWQETPCREVVRWVGMALLATGMVLSERRTLDWRNAETLAANVTAQYPLQARARQEVQEADLRVHRWQAALDRQEAIRRALDGQGAYHRAQTLRAYDASLSVLTRVSSEGNYAQALARLGRSREARAHLAWLRGAMEANHAMDPMYWAQFYYASGMIHDAAGEKAEAVMDLRDSADLMPGFDFVSRARRRIESSP